MNLLQVFMSLINEWRPAFCKQEAFQRAKQHALATLCSFGKHTITSLAIFLGRGVNKPSSDYKLYSWSKWKVEEIFNPLLFQCFQFFKEDTIVVGADDTKLKKTGKKIPFTSWQRDPMSPPFHVNFIWALRFLQFSALIPLYQNTGAPCRAIPSKRASAQQKQVYKQAQKEYNLSSIFVKEVQLLRKSIDQLGGSNKTLLMVVDGSFCNKTCMRIDIPKVQLVARCRKDAKLCRSYQGSKRKIYDDKKFTPEEIRKDEQIKWKKEDFFYGGEWRCIRYKEVNGVLWQRGCQRKQLRLIVLAPLPYVRGGRRNYRQPAYLLCTDTNGPIGKLIQAYFDRIQIEYNHRDEKSIIGVGQAQVRNEQSVAKQPGLCVAAYSALLLANIIVYKDQPHEDFGQESKWRPKPKRNSCRRLIGLLRKTLIEEPQKIVELKMTPIDIATILSKAA